MTYKLTNENCIIRLIDNARIPYDEGNRDYVEYLAWVAKGNFPFPPDEPTPVIPQSVTMRQARLALLQAGILPQVTTSINALPSPQKEAAQIEWEYSQVVERNRPFVLSLGAILGLSPAQLDNLFVTASTL